MSDRSDQLRLARSLSGKPNKEVIMVSGPPGSGKTHYVKEHKTDKDLVVDMDYLCAALNAQDDLYGDHSGVLDVACDLRDALYTMIANREGDWERCFVITAAKDFNEVNDVHFMTDATDHVKMETTLDQCLKNIQKDNRREDKETFSRLAEEWFEYRES